MEPNFQKILSDKLDHDIYELREENVRLATSLAALKTDIEQDRKFLAELEMKNLTALQFLLSTRTNSAVNFVLKINDFGNVIREASLQEEPINQKTANMHNLMQQKESHSFNECAIMLYNEVKKTIAKTRNATEAIQREKKCIRESHLAEITVLRQGLNQIHLEIQICKELEKQQRRSKLEAECTLANLNTKIKHLNAYVAKLQRKLKPK